MTEQENLPTLPVSLIETSFCKNHPDTVSGYFVLEQPWIKYCKSCAFNVALCGRKIEQELNSIQFDRKMQIGSSVSELKKTLELAQQSSLHYVKTIDILEQAAKPFGDRLKEIEQAIQNLIETKQKLRRVFRTELIQKLNTLIEKRCRLAIQCREVKAQLQNIESKYGQLIDLPDNQEFQSKLNHCSLLGKAVKKQILSEQQFIETKQRILEVSQLFYDQMQKMSKFNLNFCYEFPQFKLATQDQTFDMVLTPIEPNSLNTSQSLDLQNNNKTKTCLKLRSHKKQKGERTMTNSYSKKRESINYGQAKQFFATNKPNK